MFWICTFPLDIDTCIGIAHTIVYVSILCILHGMEQKTAPSGLRTVFNVCDTHTPIHPSLARLNIRVQNEFDIGVSRVILCTCTREQERPRQKKKREKEQKRERDTEREGEAKWHQMPNPQHARQSTIQILHIPHTHTHTCTERRHTMYSIACIVCWCVRLCVCF